MNDIDLRIGSELLNLHEFIKSRLYFDTHIESDVEYQGRLHSIEFTNLHAELLLPYLDNSEIVDLGCGQLPYINLFPNKGVRTYYGVDLHEESLEIAKDNFERDFTLSLIRHNVSQPPFDDNSVDIVISSEVIEHLDEPSKYLQEIFRIMKPSGLLSLSTPCSSMHFYPHNFLRMLKGSQDISSWYKLVNPHKNWEEALSWHPSLRPSILQQWVKDIGFTIERHETRLWYYHTPIRFVWRTFAFMERCGLKSAGKIFAQYLKFTDCLLASNLPVIKWAGTRQFILCRKPSVQN